MAQRTSGLFTGIYARGEAAALVSDESYWLAAMLDVEAALARACAAEELIPADAADAIGAACRATERFDLETLAVEAALHATPIPGLVRALRDAVGEPYAAYVHHGATSQDIVDTALMLVAARALVVIIADARAAADRAAALADAHRQTAMIGRTLMQQALPVSFGLRAAGWLTGLDAAVGGLQRVSARELAVQMGGPVGSRPHAVAARVAAELELTEPVLPWQAIRVRPAALAAALATLAGVVGKIARDVTLLAQQEVGEVRERDDGERGGSSSMAHKHNPVAAVSALACSKRIPGLVATILAAMEQEHERAAGAWQAEWGTQRELLALTGSATAWGRKLLERLEVDSDRMAANLAQAAAPAAPAPDDPDELIDRALQAHRR
jgi:3-carboxy-cis,cis-muconate cycloisomerase